jgi:hypothetical protein
LHTGSVEILEVDATTKSLGIGKTPSDSFMLDVNGNIRGSVIDSAQLITNRIYSEQGDFIAGTLEVDNLLAKYTIQSEVTGSVAAFSIHFNTTTPIDIETNFIRSLPGEPGSGLDHINMFDLIAATNSPFIGSYGEVNFNLPGGAMSTRFGILEPSDRLYEINKPVVEKSDISKVRFIFTSHTHTV